MVAGCWGALVLRVQMVMIGLMLGLLLLTGVISQAGGLAGRGSIVFASERAGSSDLYLLDIDRDYLRRLTHTQATDRRPAWSPDGRTLSFYSNRENGRWNIFIMNPNGTNIRQITETDGRDGNLAWSPDGQYVAFDSTRTGNLEIFVMETACLDAPTTCDPQRITHHAAADRSPAWSPDSTQLLFESARYEYYEIFRVNPDGSDLTRLTVNNTPDWSANWSPNGREIAFASGRGETWDIYVMDADCDTLPGGCEDNARLLVEHPYDAALPQWSPDGQHIIFEAWMDNNFDLFIVQADGQHLQRLTTHPANDTQAVWWP